MFFSFADALLLSCGGGERSGSARARPTRRQIRQQSPRGSGLLSGARRGGAQGAGEQQGTTAAAGRREKGERGTKGARGGLWLILEKSECLFAKLSGDTCQRGKSVQGPRALWCEEVAAL